MIYDTLSKKQDSSNDFLTEGNTDRVMNLFLLTNKQGAYKAINKKFYNRDHREFGTGYYFVLSEKESESFEIKDRATAQCEVRVGISLILTKSNDNITEKYLKTYSCNSVKGILSESQTYYIVYNYKQIIKIVSIKVDLNTIKSNEIGTKCTNDKCKFHGSSSEHPSACFLMCNDGNCVQFLNYHQQPCTFKCTNPHCAFYEKFHKKSCRFPCKTQNCKNFGKLHKNNCVFTNKTPKYVNYEQGLSQSIKSQKFTSTKDLYPWGDSQNTEKSGINNEKKGVWGPQQAQIPKKVNVIVPANRNLKLETKEEKKVSDGPYLPSYNVREVQRDYLYQPKITESKNIQVSRAVCMKKDRDFDHPVEKYNQEARKQRNYEEEKANLKKEVIGNRGQGSKVESLSIPLINQTSNRITPLDPTLYRYREPDNNFCERCTCKCCGGVLVILIGLGFIGFMIAKFSF